VVFELCEWIDKQTDILIKMDTGGSSFTSQASPLGKLAKRAIYFADDFSSFLYINIFNGRLSYTCFTEDNGPIFNKISGLVDRCNCKGLLTSFTFFRFHNGRCHGNQLK